MRARCTTEGSTPSMRSAVTARPTGKIARRARGNACGRCAAPETSQDDRMAAHAPRIAAGSDETEQHDGRLGFGAAAAS